MKRSAADSEETDRLAPCDARELAMQMASSRITQMATAELEQVVSSVEILEDAFLQCFLCDLSSPVPHPLAERIRQTFLVVIGEPPEVRTPASIIQSLSIDFFFFFLSGVRTGWLECCECCQRHAGDRHRLTRALGDTEVVLRLG